MFRSKLHGHAAPHVGTACSARRPAGAVPALSGTAAGLPPAHAAANTSSLAANGRADAGTNAPAERCAVALADSGSGCIPNSRADRCANAATDHSAEADTGTDKGPGAKADAKADTAATRRRRRR